MAFTEEGRPQGRRWGLAPGTDLSGLYPLFAIAFTMELGLGIVSPILPEIMSTFVLTATQIALMTTTFGLARLAVDLPVGYFMDRVDGTRMLLLGTLLVVLGSTGCALAADYTLVLVARTVMGIGTAVSLVTLLFSVSRAAKAESVGSAIGVYQASLIAGVALGPALGGVAASLAGWRAAFIVCAIAASAAAVLVVVSAARGTLKLGAVKRSREEVPYIAQESAQGRQVPWDLVAINFTTFIFFFSNSGFRNSMVPVFGGTQLGMGVATLGVLLGGSGVIRFLVTLQSGFASDRYGRKAILLPGIGFLVVGTLGYTLVRDPLAFGLCLLVLSLGGFGNSLPTAMVVDAVSGRRLGLAISANRFIGDLGMLVGPVTLGLILDREGFGAVATVTSVLLLSTLPGIVLAVRNRRPIQVAPETG